MLNIDDSLEQSVKVDEIIDLSNHVDVDDFNVVAYVGNRLVPLTLIEIDRDNNLLVLHDKSDVTGNVTACCGNCKLYLSNGICEYFNKEFDENHYCGEFIYNGVFL